jgi:hypothetical protein
MAQSPVCSNWQTNQKSNTDHPLLVKVNGSNVSKAQLGEVLLSGSENFSCRCFEPNIGRLNIS